MGILPYPVAPPKKPDGKDGKKVILAGLPITSKEFADGRMETTTTSRIRIRIRTRVAVVAVVVAKRQAVFPPGQRSCLPWLPLSAVRLDHSLSPACPQLLPRLNRACSRSCREPFLVRQPRRGECAED